MANPATSAFMRPTALERALNRAFGLIVGLGLGLHHNYLLQVRGRRTGRMYSTPVNLLEIGNKLYLVCPRGRAQWVRNAEASGHVLLKKRQVQEFALNAIPDEEKPAILKEYLERFKTTVQRYFTVRAGSPAAAFAPTAARYPVFELSRVQSFKASQV
jgi:deazaflavin-dependent oxidoreductase (nitroreductase family)